MNLSHSLEALLYFKGEPMTIGELSKILKVSPDKIHQGAEELSKALFLRGIHLIRNGEEISLATAPEVSSLIESLEKEEREKDLGRAGLETLSIVAYLGPLSKSEIEYTRGVNSSFILRHLLLRGLISKTENPNDRRGYLYTTTIELLSYLGISSLEELPELREIKKEFQEKYSRAKAREQEEKGGEDELEEK